ncbi:AAA family ATPase [Acinetobacter faecalis]|uniref:AAA family ATPase n=1 Tax=Acinetobacter faecalis TaxID=2665161 RepID=UPI002A90E708|nr:AAA family ATPase [Acinetobacter faecalis]MDY6524840.1 AAA family ATPase [Acinetobacter faecalis]
MKLVSITLENFRGYKEPATLLVDNSFTGITGKNDAGKSTVLEALDIFFGNSSIDREDKNIDADGSIKITCTFDNYPKFLSLDSGSQTSLEGEYLLNKNKLLQICKTFDFSASRASEKVSLICMYPSNEGLNDLIYLKQADLKKRITARGLNSDDVADLRSNASIRNFLYESEILNFSEQEILLNKEDAKDIWTSLLKHLPIYALFKSDRNSNDQDSEVQDPLKLAIKLALADIQPQLDEIQKHIKTRVVNVAQRTLAKLAEMDSSLAEDLIPDFTKEPDWKTLFKLSLSSEKGIAINKRGSGVRRLILLNFFRAEAERKMSESSGNSIIYAIEEPETSQHPSNQEMLIKALIKLSEFPKTQVMVTTHVPALAGLMPLDSLRYIYKSDETHRIDHPSDDLYEYISQELGIYPVKEIQSSGAKGFIFVEGISDVVFLKHIFLKLHESSQIKRNYIEDKNVHVLISGGSGNLKHWVNYKLIESLGKPWCAFFDSDNDGSNCSDYLLNIELQKKYNEQGVLFYLTKKRECENYLHPNLIKRISNGELDYVVDPYEDQKEKLHPLIAPYKSVRKTQLVEKLWSQMSSEEVIEVSNLENGENEFVNFVNLLEEKFNLSSL